MKENNFDQRLKSAEQQIVLEKMISQFLIQQTNEQIVVLNTDFTIAEVNDAYLKSFGKSKEDLIGAYCFKIIHGFEEPCSDAQPGFDCPMLETLRTGESAHVINEHPGPEGFAIYSNMVTYPVKDPNGDIRQVIEIWRDITEVLSSRWEKQAKELKADLNKLVQEDRMISLGKLAASCVHEINNPIQGLLTFTDLMKKMVADGVPNKEDLGQLEQFLSLMSKELVRCGNIVSGLLSFSRQSPMEYRDVDLNHIIDAVLLLTRHRMELQNIRLKTVLSDEPLIIKGDANHLQQCFLNLVFNAIEAMPEGGNLDVVSRYEISKRKAWIEIKDTGNGISGEDLEHIFDPFFTTKQEGEGTGLGLSIVYGIVKNHGGNIRVDSNMDQGSSFVLDFSTL
jgi:PAS domain S-box-containing protein